MNGPAETPRATPGSALAPPEPGRAGPPGDPARHVMVPVERVVRASLAVGIAASVLLMAAGILLALSRGDGLPAGVVPLAELPAALLDLESAAWLSLGLIVMIGTPFVRVAGSLVAFARERDWRYVLVTGVVLAVMCLSLLLGRV